MTRDEILKLEGYLQKTFRLADIQVRQRPQKDDSAEVYIGDEFIGVLFRDDEDEDETAYQFQMAILDHNLPGMEGILLGEYLRRHNPHITIALVTGDDDPRLPRESRQHEIEFVAKPFEPERIEQMISGIVRRLESMGETDIPSRVIGEIVMETLARIDTVAYVRFASVYKNFQAADDFEDFVAELRPPSPEG